MIDCLLDVGDVLIGSIAPIVSTHPEPYSLYAVELRARICTDSAARARFRRERKGNLEFESEM